MVYNNEICSGCGELLHEGEDIVVCPDCGTPQHRACYELNNKCVNEHLHESGFVWQPQNPPEKPQQSPTADDTDDRPYNNSEPVPVGLPMPALDVNPAFYQNAGLDPEMEFDGIKVKEAVSYTQVSAKNYVRKFIRTSGKVRFLSWNWGAFFFSPAWFFYRKLYKLGFIFLGLIVGVTLILTPQLDRIAETYEAMTASIEEYRETLDSSGEALTAENEKILTEKTAEIQKLMNDSAADTALVFLGTILIPNCAAALIANSFYKRKMLEDIKYARRLSPDAQVVKYAILRSGGVAIIPAFAALMAQNYLPALILKIVNYFILK